MICACLGLRLDPLLLREGPYYRLGLRPRLGLRLRRGLWLRLRLRLRLRQGLRLGLRVRWGMGHRVSRRGLRVLCGLRVVLWGAGRAWRGGRWSG